MNNTSNLIIQLEPSLPIEIFLESKIPTGVSLLSRTGASVTPEIRIPIKKYIKSPAMSPPRKYPIPNQDSNILINKQDKIIPPIL